MTGKPNYRAVAQDDDPVGLDARLPEPATRFSTGDKVKTYLHSVFWVALAVLLLWRSKLFQVVSNGDERLRWPFLVCGMASTLTVIGIFTYLTVWLPMVKKQYRRDFNEFKPKHIQVATALMVAQFFLYCIALWPVYGFASPVLVGVTGMGALFSLNLLPSCPGGSKQQAE
ncbi:MAG: hypothetical protein MHM6MM_006091 [Cercozoa sp. M6MM]